MKPWEWLVIGAIVLIGGWYLYNQYNVPMGAPMTNGPATGDSETGSGSGGVPINYFTPPMIGPVTQGPNGVPAVNGIPVTSPDFTNGSIAQQQVTQYQTLNPTSLVPGTGGGGFAAVQPPPAQIASTTHVPILAAQPHASPSISTGHLNRPFQPVTFSKTVPTSVIV